MLNDMSNRRSSNLNPKMNSSTNTEENQAIEPDLSSVMKEGLPTIHLFHGVLGGSGKSTGSRLMCERYRSRKQEFTLIDADPNYNVARAYQKDVITLWERKSNRHSTADTSTTNQDIDNSMWEGSHSSSSIESSLKLLEEQIIFSRDTKFSYLGDRFLEAISFYGHDFVVSLPAGDDIEFWLDSNNIDSLIETNSLPFKIINWWISFGSISSQEKLVNFIQKYPHLNHVCVFNQGITSVVPNWGRFSVLPALRKMAQEGRVKKASILPWQSDPAILEAVEAGQPLHEIIENGWQGKALNPIVKGKIEKWLETNWLSFEATGYL